MRLYELLDGISMMVNIEEQQLLDVLQSNPRLSDLSERQREMARKMVSRGLISRSRDDEGTFYKIKTKDQ